MVKNKKPSPEYLFHFHHLGILEGCLLRWDVNYAADWSPLGLW